MRPRVAACALGYLCACATRPDLDSEARLEPVTLEATPGATRRVAEALLPVGDWLVIAKETRGSWRLWRFVRRLDRDDVRSILLDQNGKVWERTHVERAQEFVQRGPGDELTRRPRW